MSVAVVGSMSVAVVGSVSAAATGRRGEEGFILPAVVAILLVVALACAGAVRALQTRTAATADHAASLRLQGIADGVARLMAMSLVVQHARRGPGLGLPEDGTAVACPLPAGVTVVVSVQDQAGLIDLNASPRPFMEDAFRVLGVPDREAAALAAEIVDARDADDVPEPNGAEAPQYRARGLSGGPRNAPFETVEEIETLPSMTEALAARLRPFVTVYNANGGIDGSVTPGRVFAGGVLAHDLNRRASTSPHQAYALTAIAYGARGAQAGRRAILSINALRNVTGLIAWRHAHCPFPGAAPHPACAGIALALDPG